MAWNRSLRHRLAHKQTQINTSSNTGQPYQLPNPSRMSAGEVGELYDEMRADIEGEMGSTSAVFEDWRNGDAGAIFVAEKLRGNTTVERLILQSCEISAVGARALAESLSGHNDSLKMLWLWDNDIGDDGAQALAQMLKKNTTLEELRLEMCSVGVRGARALGEALKENFALKRLDLEKNPISDDGAGALAEGLRWNESLEVLDLEECELTDAGASSLLAALRESNFTLTKLESNEITGSIEELLWENKKVNPASAERRARCLLFCCLQLAPTAHESVVPSIGAVPVPVMQYAVEHAGKLHVAKRFEWDALVKGQLASHHALAAQAHQNAQLQQQNAQLQQQSQRSIADLRQQIAQLHSRSTEPDAAAGASLASHTSTSSSDEEDGEPANKRAKTG